MPALDTNDPATWQPGDLYVLLMFEYHGWATIRDTAGCEDPPVDPVEETLDAIRREIVALRMERFASLARANIDWFLTISGLNNHRNPSVVALFERVARAAPGSYGILYTHDAEANLGQGQAPYADEIGESPERWYCRVMKRGRVTRHDDHHLSPHIGEVEDDCSE